MQLVQEENWKLIVIPVIVAQTIEKLRALNAYATLMMMAVVLYAPPVINVARLAMEQEKMLVRVAILIFHLQALLRVPVNVLILPNILIQMELVRTVTILG